MDSSDSLLSATPADLLVAVDPVPTWEHQWEASEIRIHTFSSKHVDLISQGVCLRGMKKSKNITWHFYLVLLVKLALDPKFG